MKAVYPVVFTKLEDGYMAYVPDMEINTQGDNLPEAIAMARDDIGLMGIDMEDEHKDVPTPSSMEAVPHEQGEIVSMVDIDFDVYRRAQKRRAVRRNVTLPAWLDMAAEKAGINVSAVLQEALKHELQLVGK